MSFEAAEPLPPWPLLIWLHAVHIDNQLCELGQLEQEKSAPEKRVGRLREDGSGETLPACRVTFVSLPGQLVTRARTKAPQ